MDDDVRNHRHVSKYTNVEYGESAYTKLLEGNFITIAALVRTRYLAEAGGFDEFMPALEDWELWLRIARHHKIACVKKPLLIVYSQREREHVGGSAERTITAINRIEHKNMDYLAEHKYIHWRFLHSIVMSCVFNKEYYKGVKVWLNAVRLQPLRLVGNMLMITSAYYRAYYALCRGALSSYLRRKNPRLFYRLKTLKDKLKGEYTK